MKMLTALFVLTLSSQLIADEKAICGLDDSRVKSYDRKIGKIMRKPGAKLGCSATLISNKCLLTAGHCSKYFRYIEFDVEKAGVAVHPTNRYEIDRSSIISEDWASYDFAVMKVKKNDLTGKYPGDRRGFYKLNFSQVKRGTPLRITGYGKDTNDSHKSYTQQTDTGFAYGQTLKYLYHGVDTEGGNSGSSIINDLTGEVVGVHTNGGCNSGSNSSNRGNAFYDNERLQKAIRSCLEE